METICLAMSVARSRSFSAPVLTSLKMISSAAGLLVGMIAYACYHYLVYMIDRVINKMEINAVQFIDLLEEPVKG